MTKTTLFGTAILALFLALQNTSALASENDRWLSAKDDYITCWQQPCVFVEGSKWSEKNPNGVAVSVAFGAKPAVTDDQIKTILTEDFSHYGVTQLKFFYERNDAPASVIGLHVRGGTEGPFLIGTVRQEIERIAQRVSNENPVFRSN